MAKPVVLIVGHGSREKAANAQFKTLVRRYAALRPQYDIDYAFLELTRPHIGERLEEWASSKREIYILPLFLFAAGHANRDIPRINKAFSEKYPSIKIRMANVIGPDPKMARLATLRALSLKGDPSKTVLLLVGRGAREKRAQQDLRKLAAWIGKSHRFEKVHPCFYAMAEPDLDKTLKKVVFGGSKSIWLMPYLFFNGDLVSRIRVKMVKFLRKNKGMTVKISPPLGMHKLLFQVMDARLRQTVEKKV